MCFPKYRDQYERGDQAKRDQIVARSRRRGKNGYQVGTDIMFLGEKGLRSQGGSGEGRELSYAHIRSGHPHAVRYGPGKKLVKIAWYRSTTVRPDLPFKE